MRTGLTGLALVILLTGTYSTNPAEQRNLPTGAILETAAPVINTEIVDKPTREYLGEFELSAYDAGIESCGKPDGITKSGAKVTEGVTIATDWAVIPKGWEVEIEGIGSRVAQDIGGAIKGRRIDLYIADHKEAVQFGRPKTKFKVWRVLK